MQHAPIGIFDSGLGGLSVWREAVKQVSNESILYYGDSANCPYGARPASEVWDLSRRIVDFLLKKGAKLIVIACNTATAAAIEKLRAEYDVPFVGMEPALKPAAKATQSGVIGILATKGTFSGNHFQRTQSRFAPGKEVLIREGDGLVELVENGQTHSPDAERLVSRYLMPMLEQGADQIVLGCSHYPFLLPVMQKVVGEQARIIDPAPAVVRQIGRLLDKNGLRSEENSSVAYKCYTSGELDALKRMVAQITEPVVYQKCEFLQG